MTPPKNLEPCPVCPMPVGEHTVDQLADHLSEAHDHDLPYEATPLKYQDMQVVVCGSLAVKAGTNQTPLGVFPVLLFEFTTTDGPLAPICLLLDARHMKSIKTLITAAVDGAVSAAKKAS